MKNLFERKVARVKGNSWEAIRFEDLKEGDLFRIWEFNGTPVTYKGSGLLYAISNAKEVPGTWGVEVKPAIRFIEGEVRFEL